MINLIGKTLVAFNVALSLILITFAVGIYTNRIDWGWREPQQDLGTRIPSEIDKRTAAVKMFLRHRDQVEAALNEAQQETVKDAEDWAISHLNQEQMVAEVDKAIVAKNKTHLELQTEAKKLQEQIGAELEKLTKLSGLISGVMDPDKKKKLEPGLTDLLEEEHQLHNQLRKEIEAIRPFWVRKLVESQILVARREALQQRLNELTGKMTEKKP
jgi:hypothetical protein